MHFTWVSFSLYYATQNSLCEALNCLNIAAAIFKRRLQIHHLHNERCFQRLKINLLCSVVYQLGKLLLYFSRVFKNIIFSQSIFSSFSQDTIYLNCFYFRCASLASSAKQYFFYIFLINYFVSFNEYRVIRSYFARVLSLFLY